MSFGQCPYSVSSCLKRGQFVLRSFVKKKNNNLFRGHLHELVYGLQQRVKSFLLGDIFLFHVLWLSSKLNILKVKTVCKHTQDNYLNLHHCSGVGGFSAEGAAAANRLVLHWYRRQTPGMLHIMVIYTPSTLSQHWYRRVSHNWLNRWDESRGTHQTFYLSACMAMI